MKFIFTCLFIFSARHLFSQQQVSSKPLPLIIIGQNITNAQSLILNENKISSIKVLKIKKAKKKYGEKGKNGAMIIHLKDNTILMRLDPLLKRWELPDSLKKFRVCINEVVVEDPDLLLIDPEEVEGISTFNATDWSNLARPTNEKFLNISRKGRKD